MADGVNIDTLEIEIEASSEEATKKLNTLTESLRKLQDQTKQKFGNIFKQINTIGEDASPAEKKLHEKMELLKRVRGIDVAKNVRGISSLVTNVTRMEKELARARKTREQLGEEMLKIQNQLDQQLEFEPKFRNNGLIRDFESQLEDLGKEADTQEAKIRTLEATLENLQGKLYTGQDLGSIVAESNAAIEEAKARAKELSAQMREIAKDAAFLDKERFGLTNDLAKAEIQAAKTDGTLADMRRKLKEMSETEGIGAEAKAAIQAAQENVEKFASAADSVKNVIADIGRATEVLNNVDLSNLSGQEIRESAAELKGLKQEYRELIDAAKLAGASAKNAMAEARDAIKGVKGSGPGKELGFLAQASELAKVRDEIVKLTAPARKLVASLKDIGRSALDASKDLVKLGLSSIGSALGKVVDGAKNVGKHIVDKVTRPIKTAAAAFEKWKSAIGRIALYRVIREAIKTVTDGLKTGIQNLYQYSRLVGTEFAPAMDRLATSSLYLKNSLGAMAAPLIQALAPAVDFIIDKFVALFNIIGKVFAALTGKSVYTQAKKHAVEYGEAAKEASKATKDFLLGIDELNVLNDSSGGTGGAASDFGSMFEEVEIPNDIKDWTDKIREAIENGEWRKVGEIVADKLNEIVDSWDSYAWGEKLGGLINNGLNVAYGFLTEFNFENLGFKVADFFNGIFDKVDWDLLGRTFAAGWNGLMEFVYGLITGFHWDVFGKAIADAIVGFFDEIDWELPIKILKAGIDAVRDALVGFLSEFGEKLDIHGIADPLVEIVNTVADTLQQLITDTQTWFSQLDFTPLVSSFESLLAAIAPLVETISNGLLWAYENVLLPLASWTLENAVPETINFFAEAFGKLNEVLNQIDFAPIIEAFQRLGESISPLVEIISGGLMRAFTDVLLPLGRWTIEEAAPAAVELLASAFDLLHAALERVSPILTGFIETVVPAAQKVIIETLNGIRDTFDRLTSLIRGDTTFGEFFNGLSSGAQIALTLGAAIGGITLALGIAGTAISVFAGIAKTAHDTIKAVKLAIEGVSLVLSLITSPVGIAVAAIAGLVAAVALCAAHFEGFRETVKQAWEGIKTTLGEVASRVMTYVVSPVVDAWNNHIKPVIDSLVDRLGDAITNHIVPLLQTAMQVIGKVAEVVGFVFDKIIGPLVKWVIDTAAPVVGAAIGFVGDVFITLANTIADVSSGILETFGGVIDFVAGVFTGDWERAWNGVKEIFSGVWDTMVGVVEGAVNLIINGINLLIQGLNALSFDMPDWLGGGHFGFNIREIQEVSFKRLDAKQKASRSEYKDLLGTRNSSSELLDSIRKVSWKSDMNMSNSVSDMMRNLKEVTASNLNVSDSISELTKKIQAIEPVQPQYVQRQNPYATMPAAFAQAQSAGASISNYNSTTTNETGVDFTQDRIISAMGSYAERIIDAIYANGGITIVGKTLLRAVEKADRERGVNLMGGILG